MSLQVALFVFASALFIYTLVANRSRLRALGRRTPAPALGRYPSLSIIRPIRGLDPGAEENIAAALDNGYPGEIETIFVFDEESEPALPLVRRAIAAHEAGGRPGRASILIAGPPRPGRTGKLNAMIAGAAAAHGDLIGFADSDIRPHRRALAGLVELLLSTSGAGDVFAPVIATEPAQALGDVGYALMLNALYAPEVRLWAQRHGQVPFIMGQLMIFHRETLQAIGGLDCAAGQLVDDMHIGTCVRDAGYKNVMSTEPVAVIDWGMSASEFARTYRRWLAFSRNGLSKSFWISAAQPYLAFWLGLLGSLLGQVDGYELAAIPFALLFVSSGASLLVLNRAAGAAAVPWRYCFAPYLLLLAGPFVLLSQLLWPEVRWRGRTYGLDAGAHLSSSPTRVTGVVRRLLEDSGATGPGGPGGDASPPMLLSSGASKGK